MLIGLKASLSDSRKEPGTFSTTSFFNFGISIWIRSFRICIPRTLIPGLPALAADSLSVKEGIKREYAAHETAGHDYWADFRAELAYDYREGNITLSNVIYIEDQLSDVTKYLLTGDWLTAQEKLSAITASGALTQAILDDLTAGISSYITNNY